MTSEELRKIYCDRLKKEKQCYISKMTHINSGVLSQFKNEKFDLYPDLHKRLEQYLMNT